MKVSRGFLKITPNEEHKLFELFLEPRGYEDDLVKLKAGDELTVYDLTDIPDQEDFPLPILFEGRLSKKLKSFNGFGFLYEIESAPSSDLIRAGLEGKLAVVTRYE